jgi:hypothetical protein
MDLRGRTLAAVDGGMSRRAAVMAALEEERDQSLEELRARLAGRGIVASTSALSRFFQRHGLTRKKRPGMPATGPMAPVASGATCSRKGLPAGCAGSNG